MSPGHFSLRRHSKPSPENAAEKHCRPYHLLPTWIHSCPSRTVRRVLATREGLAALSSSLDVRGHNGSTRAALEEDLLHIVHVPRHLSSKPARSFWKLAGWLAGKPTGWLADWLAVLGLDKLTSGDDLGPRKLLLSSSVSLCLSYGFSELLPSCVSN